MRIATTTGYGRTTDVGFLDFTFLVFLLHRRGLLICMESGLQLVGSAGGGGGLSLMETDGVSIISCTWARKRYDRMESANNTLGATSGFAYVFSGGGEMGKLLMAIKGTRVGHESRKVGGRGRGRGGRRDKVMLDIDGAIVWWA